MTDTDPAAEAAPAADQADQEGTALQPDDAGDDQADAVALSDADQEAIEAAAADLAAALDSAAGQDALADAFEDAEIEAGAAAEPSGKIIAESADGSVQIFESGHKVVNGVTVAGPGVSPEHDNPAPQPGTEEFAVAYGEPQE